MWPPLRHILHALFPKVFLDCLRVSSSYSWTYERNRTITLHFWRKLFLLLSMHKAFFTTFLLLNVQRNPQSPGFLRQYDGKNTLLDSVNDDIKTSYDTSCKSMCVCTKYSEKEKHQHHQLPYTNTVSGKALRDFMTNSTLYWGFLVWLMFAQSTPITAASPLLFQWLIWCWNQSW